mmetsp:Transcript_26187/g.66627  ORF Transcript_26187/g.66627 Transcript_26187/m.66627 type:complete len:83 (+) Transcript_26187:87-335(+)
MRPSDSRIVRSDISEIPTLCVMTTVVAPSSLFTWSSASRTWMPVLLSRAPVGSSQKSNAGRFAIARATATRCCSPPDSSAGK